jgi:hypothetical protein
MTVVVQHGQAEPLPRGAGAAAVPSFAGEWSHLSAPRRAARTFEMERKYTG